MRIEKRDGADERRVLIGMIVHTRVLSMIAAQWKKEGLFRSTWANLIGKWCVNYYDKYKKAPKANVQGSFEAWASQGTRDKDTVKLVEKFLGNLSDEYTRLRKEINPDYTVDLASRHFQKVSLLKLTDEINGHIDNGDLDKARIAQDKYGTVEIRPSAGIDLFQDMSIIDRAFDAKQEPIIKYPGSLGLFFGDALERDGFIGFMGPEKRGKSFVLLDMAYRAMLQRRKVAYFQVGDLSEHQVTWRFMVRAAKYPRKARTIKYPTSIDADGAVTFKEIEYKKNLTRKMARRAFKRVMMDQVKSKDSYFKLSVHPNSSISVLGIKAIIEAWDRQGWNPDVVVIDYADILAPISGDVDSRDQINMTWNRLRTLSQEMHCLVVTATQTKADSYTADIIGRRHFADDKRKFAHVTGMLGLSQTDEEKEIDVMRFNWIQLREDEFTEGRCVRVAGCRHLANIAIKSTY